MRKNNKISVISCSRRKIKKVLFQRIFWSNKRQTQLIPTGEFFHQRKPFMRRLSSIFIWFFSKKNTVVRKFLQLGVRRSRIKTSFGPEFFFGRLIIQNAKFNLIINWAVIRVSEKSYISLTSCEFIYQFSYTREQTNISI